MTDLVTNISKAICCPGKTICQLGDKCHADGFVVEAKAVVKNTKLPGDQLHTAASKLISYLDGNLATGDPLALIETLRKAL